MTRRFYEDVILAAVNGILSNPERAHMTPFKVAGAAIEIAQQVCMAAGYPAAPGMTATAGKTIREVRTKMLHDALENNDGDKARAAKELGVDLRTVYNWLDQEGYGGQVSA
jgi:transcriptional regulator with PAS, ATPase and Fis domain